ncbi:MAG TPA: SMI1/KNR4 family protein [Allosphingosinicella sp.]|nr:SMI1/KNR4 family protein [Allosphingosinicella sp.]
MSLARFAELWTHPEYPPTPVSEFNLRAVEKDLGFTFPTDYRDAVVQVGLVSPTIELLDTIVNRELDMADLSELLEPNEILATTEVWREMGLPADLVAFATDCSGNLFCFGPNGAPTIFLFDHDFGTTREVAPSFSQWIDRFCALAE